MVEEATSNASPPQPGPPEPSSPGTGRSVPTHLYALGGALACLALLLQCAAALFQPFERRYLRELLALPFPEKNQGVFLQQTAFTFKDVLPVYGSSELTSEMDNRADEFYYSKPTGFQVCPVGAPGNHTLLMAEKVAALGDAVRAQKVAVILSSTWFRGKPMGKDHVAGNFSPLQAINLLRNREISAETRLRFARRMLDYPESLNKSPLITWYLESLASNRWWAPVVRCTLSPMLGIHASLLNVEDHLNTTLAGYKYGVVNANWSRKKVHVKWGKVLRRIETEEDIEAEKEARPPGSETQSPILPGSRDEEYISEMSHAQEWDDFALLLDTLRELKAKPLIISVPLPGVASDTFGISRVARDYYYHRIVSMSASRGFLVNTFSDHDQDPGFIVGMTTHLEPKGWLYTNRLLDDFFHDRLRKKRP